jgi:hypothetical protein
MPAGKRTLVQKRYGNGTAAGGPAVQAKADPGATGDAGPGTGLLDAAKARHATRRNPHWTRELGTTPADWGAPSLAVDSLAFAEHIAGLQAKVASLKVDGIAGPRTMQALSIRGSKTPDEAAATSQAAPDAGRQNTTGNATGSGAGSDGALDPLGLSGLFTWVSNTVGELLRGKDTGGSTKTPESGGSGEVDNAGTVTDEAKTSGAPEKKEPTGEPATLKDTDLAALVASLRNAYVDGVAQDLAALQQKAAKLWEERSAGEEKGKERDELVAGIGALRARIAGLDSAGLEPARCALLKKLMYRAVHDLAPFYAQATNIDLLEGKEQAAELGTTTTVTTRTCNITSLSMALESLGKSAADYSGSQAKIDAAAKVFSSEVGTAKLRVGKDTAGLRMSDFMQLAAIAEVLGSDTSAKAVTAAAVSAWEKILSIGFLKTLAARFGVGGSVKLFSTSAGATQKEKESQTAALRGYGSKHRKVTEKLVDARNKWEESGSDKDKQAYEKLKKEADAGLSGKGIEDTIGIEAYKNAVIEQIGAELDGGSAVVVLLSGHYVRLQAIHDDHCVVDDPAQQARANRKVLWPEARAMGYFSYRLVLG